uniref:VWFA domain-containing protein n=1 Tax=Globodera pallida TaxID=36090 RepID=A0A183BT21_GLOPA
MKIILRLLFVLSTLIHPIAAGDEKGKKLMNVDMLDSLDRKASDEKKEMREMYRKASEMLFNRHKEFNTNFTKGVQDESDRCGKAIEGIKNIMKLDNLDADNFNQLEIESMAMAKVDAAKEAVVMASNGLTLASQQKEQALIELDKAEKALKAATSSRNEAEEARQHAEHHEELARTELKRNEEQFDAVRGIFDQVRTLFEQCQKAETLKDELTKQRSMARRGTLGDLLADAKTRKESIYTSVRKQLLVREIQELSTLLNLRKFSGQSIEFVQFRSVIPSRNKIYYLIKKLGIADKVLQARDEQALSGGKKKSISRMIGKLFEHKKESDDDQIMHLLGGVLHFYDIAVNKVSERELLEQTTSEQVVQQIGEELETQLVEPEVRRQLKGVREYDPEGSSPSQLATHHSRSASAAVDEETSRSSTSSTSSSSSRGSSGKAKVEGIRKGIALLRGFPISHEVALGWDLKVDESSPQSVDYSIIADKGSSETDNVSETETPTADLDIKEGSQNGEDDNEHEGEKHVEDNREASELPKCEKGSETPGSKHASAESIKSESDGSGSNASAGSKPSDAIKSEVQEISKMRTRDGSARNSPATSPDTHLSDSELYISKKESSKLGHNSNKKPSKSY